MMEVSNLLRVKISFVFSVLKINPLVIRLPFVDAVNGGFDRI